MNDGALLKYYRKKKGWNQEEVSNGIVSTSYYSKIENDLIVPAPETYSLLFEKLGVERSKIEEEKSAFKLLLQKWEQPLLFNQKNESTLINGKLEKMLDSILEIELLLEFQVKKIRFLILTGNLDEISNLEVILTGLTDKFDRRTEYFYYKYLGNFFYAKGHLSKANESFEIAISLYTPALFSVLEKADLHYLYSLVLSRLRNDYKSLNFAESSLDIFRENYRLESCARAHIQIGICSSRLKNIDMALKHYNMAKDLTIEKKNFKLLGIIEHNIANLLFRQNNLNAAISHLERAIQHKQESYDSSYFSTLILLITYNYADGKVTSCEKWVRKGLSLLNEDRSTKIQKLEIEFYKKFLLDNDSTWESFCTKSFFPYLKENKKWSHLITYSKMIGNYFNGKNIYKKSAVYYQEVINSYEEIYIN